MRLIILLSLLVLLSCSKNHNDQSLILKERKKHSLFIKNVKHQQGLLNDPDFSFTGVEVIYIQSGKEYYQWFGHSILRFIGSGLSPDKDLTVSFIADFNDDEMNMSKAYYGGYVVLPIIKTYKETVDDYLLKEERYMDRYVFPTTENYRQTLLNKLRQWVKDPSIPGTYSFRRNGCTALILKLLAPKKSLNRNEVVFPVEVAPYLKKIGLITEKYKRLNLDNVDKNLLVMKPYLTYQEPNQ